MSAAEAAAGGSTAIREFHISFAGSELTELRRRINATRWPEQETVEDDSQGVPLATCRSSLATGRRTTTGTGARAS